MVIGAVAQTRTTTGVGVRLRVRCQLTTGAFNESDF